MVLEDIGVFLNELEAMGVELSVADDKLIIKALKGTLNSKTRDRLFERKKDIFHYLKNCIGDVEKPNISTEASIDEDCMVLLRSGKKDCRLFIIHPISGGVHRLIKLANEMDPCVTIYGMQNPDLRKTEIQLTTVESMAEYYIRQMQLIQPSGHYFVAGWCTGGVIAWHVVHLIESMGNSATLILIDTPYNLLIGTDSIQTDYDNERNVWSSFIGATLFDPNVVDHSDDSMFWQLSHSDKLGHLLLMARQDEYYRGTYNIEDMERRYRYIKNSLSAYENYCAPHIRSSVKYYVAGSSLINARPLYEETDYPSNIEVKVVPGDHFSLMLGEEVRELAEGMSCYMLTSLNK